ncbi:hypothetical protein Cni_G24951 [Canna indica]|uniref:Myb-like domain-containing protein n=1 Tax=Canna indica TaxID=4628 RepID=A0AAQ3QLY0_9LILI|nr:hypothetical protein Cni_G24951 [Canna indica]
MADGSGGGEGGARGEGGDSARRHRLPRWTRQEIMVLIEGKKAAEGLGRGPRAAAMPAETKWTAVSSYCKRKGVERGPRQCRKRWSNLACDFKKIRAWEMGEGAASGESFWSMRNGRRRDRRLPGFFDEEVYHVLEGSEGEEADEEAETKGGDGSERADENGRDEEEEEENEEASVFASGRNAAEMGFFSNFKQANWSEMPLVVTPISVRRFEPLEQEFSDPGPAIMSWSKRAKLEDHWLELSSLHRGDHPCFGSTMKGKCWCFVVKVQISWYPSYRGLDMWLVKVAPYSGYVGVLSLIMEPCYLGVRQSLAPSIHLFGKLVSLMLLLTGFTSDQHQTNDSEKQSSPQGRKRRRNSPDGVGNNNFHKQLINVLERNNEMLVAQLKAQNANLELDRDQRREQTKGLLEVLNKLADALGRIAEKI